MNPHVAMDHGASLTSVGSTSSSPIERIKRHDQMAWRRLVRLYGPLVSFWIRRASLHAADTPDVFQTGFMAVAKGIDQFKGRPGDSFYDWGQGRRRRMLPLTRRPCDGSAGQVPGPVASRGTGGGLKVSGAAKNHKAN